MKDVVIVSACRTAIGAFGGSLKDSHAAKLAAVAMKEAVKRAAIEPGMLTDVRFGCCLEPGDALNVARVGALLAGIPETVTAVTINRVCTSAMEATISGMAAIQTGMDEIVLAGGTEHMSGIAYTVPSARWGCRLQDQIFVDTMMQALHVGSHLIPHPEQGPVKSGMPLELFAGKPYIMGATAEFVAQLHNISREEMDAYAVESHRRVAAAQDAGHFAAEIVPLIDRDGTVYKDDDGLRRDASMAALGKLKPFFDKPYGRVTAGNSSQITDGAAWLVLASADSVERFGLTPLGRIVDSEWAGLAPEQMGLGPVHAALPMLQRHGLTPPGLDAWELNEAFAAQVIACQRAFGDDDYVRTHFGLEQAPGAPAADRFNVDGGAVALGHPVGASGVRIVLHLLQVLRRTGGRRGVASICIGGGQGGAMLVEALQ
ncbi:MAG: acetyl-CoA C-acyltransferase [Betaproteobacteria bacterium HGW-Betaproteobacteria-21]|nr:MAG: acetyl-CoA C-acyltransferase [Betaproteobacteria bacterium HGW-Betaproteobacteria-21]